MTPRTIIRPALGQTAALGDLYDARTDTFSTVSLFSRPPPGSAITSTDSYSSEIKYVHADSYKEKFNQFGINPQLSASVAAGVVDVGGSGRYLTSLRDTKLMAQSSLIYNITTVNERINFQLDELDQCLALSILEDDIATHVVSEINWGSRNVVTASQKASQEDDTTLMAGNLNARLKCLSFKAGGEFDRVNAESSLDNSFEVSVEADVVATDGSVPTDLASAEAFIRNVKKYVDRTNGGKGRPLCYTLLSLSDLARLLKVQFAEQVVLREVSSHCAEEFVHLFDEMAVVRQEMNDRHSLIVSHMEYVSRTDLSASTEAVRQVHVLEARLRTQYRQTISNVRAGKEDESVLWKVLNDFKCDENSVSQVTKFDFRPLQEKIQLLTGLVGMGATYIGFNGGSFELELARIQDTDLFVFNFSGTSRLREPRVWLENIAILHRLLRQEGPSQKVLLRDCDAMDEILENPQTVLYRNGEVIIENVLEKERLAASKPTARYISAYLDRSDIPKPIPRIPVSISCPGRKCSRGAKYDWTCSECDCRIEYGHIDTYIYCDCGRCEYRYWEFRCPNQEHSLGFTGYEHSTLLKRLNNLEPFDECNILILGRTGVGKSTWINSLANYLLYPTLDDALEADSLSWTIPFAFTTYQTNKNGDYEAVKVHAGFGCPSYDTADTRKVSVEEHDGSTGQSATQRTVVHRVQIDKRLIRLIDTPGIGDTRGASRDKENMADILNVLQSYPKLHGILILLKPNEQKLDIMFKFCMQELLTHLHRDAARNIAFGFTNTRGTNYQPGDSFGPLSQLLQKFSGVDIALRAHNVYCFDSESFRYLAAYKQRNQFLGPFEENRRSWDYSVRESKRLLHYFQELEPHQVNSSVNLYQTRTCILKMAQPMTDIAQAITNLIAVNKDDISKLNRKKKDRKDLEKDLRVKVATLSASPLDNPTTTCHSAECTRHVSTGSLGLDGKQVLNTVYKHRCHSPCQLTGVTIENIGNPKLSRCAAMNSRGTCKVCNHSWKEHLHIDYEQVEGTVEVDDPTIVSLLKENATDAEMKQAAITAKKGYIKELESELQEFTLAAAQFSHFLKRNAIMPYNDATLDYLDRIIDDEKQKTTVGGSRDKLQQLLQYRKQYEQEIEILSEQMGKGEGHKLLDRAGVEALVRRLHSLPHYGQTLKNIGKVVDRVQSVEHREKSYTMRARPHTTRKKDVCTAPSVTSGGFWKEQSIEKALEGLKAAKNWAKF